MRRSPIIICLMLLLASPVMAGNVWNFTSVGFSVDMDGNVGNAVQTGVATFISTNAYIVASAQYDRDINNPEEGYGLQGTYGYILSKFFTVTGSLSGIKTETPEGTIGYGLVNATVSLFPWGNLYQDGKEKVGATLGFSYKPATEKLVGYLQVTTFFGK